jgi:hypothetical protein
MSAGGRRFIEIRKLSGKSWVRERKHGVTLGWRWSCCMTFKIERLHDPLWPHSTFTFPSS